MSTGGVSAVLGMEGAKLAAQPKTWALLGACLAGPFAFVAALRTDTSLPEDTLFGRSTRVSGFAVPLVILGFAALWAFPLLGSAVGGDIFSAEDRYGTWPNLLTRGRTRTELFVGKVLATLAFAVATVVVLAISSTAAGMLMIGHQPLLGLTGTELSPERAFALVALAWASVLLPVFGFTALAVLVSVATRSGIAGVGVPVLMGFLMQLVAAMNVPGALRCALLTPPFVAWHGLFAEHPYYGPLIQGAATSVAYVIACLVAAYVELRRRVMAG